MCDPDYQGVTLQVATRTRPLIASAIQTTAAGWEKQTCGKINILEFPVDQLYQTYLSALVAGEGKLDVITFGPFWTPDFAPYLSEWTPRSTIPAGSRRWKTIINGLNVAPPGALGFTSGDIHNIFAGGSVAMNFDWGDTGVNAADPKASLIPGKVGTALLPGSKRVWNDQTRQWDAFPEVVRVPFLAFGGWQAAVPANSNHIEAAWHFIAWLSSPEVSGEAVVTPQSGINPYRQSHFDPKLWLKLFTPEEARLYLDAQLKRCPPAKPTACLT